MIFNFTPLNYFCDHALSGFVSLVVRYFSNLQFKHPRDSHHFRSLILIFLTPLFSTDPLLSLLPFLNYLRLSITYYSINSTLSYSYCSCSLALMKLPSNIKLRKTPYSNYLQCWAEESIEMCCWQDLPRDTLCKCVVCGERERRLKEGKSRDRRDEICWVLEKYVLAMCEKVIKA